MVAKNDFRLSTKFRKSFRISPINFTPKELKPFPSSNEMNRFSLNDPIHNPQRETGIFSSKVNLAQW